MCNSLVIVEIVYSIIHRYWHIDLTVHINNTHCIFSLSLSLACASISFYVIRILKLQVRIKCIVGVVGVAAKSLDHVSLVHTHSFSARCIGE